MTSSTLIDAPIDRAWRAIAHTHWSDVSGRPDAPGNYQQLER